MHNTIEDLEIESPNFEEQFENAADVTVNPEETLLSGEGPVSPKSNLAKFRSWHLPGFFRLKYYLCLLRFQLHRHLQAYPNMCI